MIRDPKGPPRPLTLLPPLAWCKPGLGAFASAVPLPGTPLSAPCRGVAQLVLDVVEKLSILKGKKVAVIEYFLSTKLYSRQFVYITLFNSHYNLLSYLLSIHILQLRKRGFRDKVISSRSQNKWVVLELSASPWSLLCPMLSPSMCGDIIFSSRHQSQEFLYGLKTTNKVWIS